jgi:DNA-binding MarR family transcriptional regulator
VQYIQNEQDRSLNRRTAIMVSDSARRREEIMAVAEICNTSVLGCDWDNEEPEDFPHADLLLMDIPSISDRNGHTLLRAARYLNVHRNHALIWTNMEYLEEAYAVLPQDQCHYLVNASDFDAIPYLTGAITRGTMDQLHDNSRDGEFGALHKISDELAAFAQTLARMAEHDDGNRANSVSDRPVSFRPAPAAAFHPFGKNEAQKAADKAPDITANSIREIIKVRRMRDNFFKAELFADPAWDILLDLMAARLEERTVSVSSLCIAAAVPPTTALRWITAMTESGLLVRRLDPNDARRVFIELSQDSTDRMLALFNSTKGRTASII